MNACVPRMPALDGLRGVAILMVLLTHAADGWVAARSITEDTLTWPATFILPGWLACIASYGVHGVTLFFVVSAFTLTLSIAGNGDLGRYALRRVARVGPGYWLAGIAYTLAAGLGPRLWAPDGVTVPDLALAAVFGSAWQGGAAMAVVPGGWSVSCEAAFYVALPLVLLAVQGRILSAALLTAVAAASVQAVASRAIAHGTWHFVPDHINPGAQAPVFLLSVTAALIVRRIRLPAVPGLAMGLLTLAVLGVPFSPVRAWYMLPHLQFAAVAAAVVALAAAHPPRLLANAALRRVGEVSYSMYLIHFALLAPSLTVAEWLAPADGWRTLALHAGTAAAASFGAACLTHRWVEQPCIRWAARLIQAMRPAAATG